MRFLFWLFLILFLIFRFAVSRPQYTNGQRLQITGQIAQEPREYGASMGFNLAGVRIYLPKTDDVGFGDILTVRGMFKDGKLDRATLVKKESKPAWYMAFKEALVGFYGRSLPEPHASLVAGIVLGSRGSFPPDFWDDIRAAGVAHVVVASGMNVAFVAGALLAISSLYFPRKTSLGLVIAGVWGYSAISGFEAPIVRAAVMISLAFCAQVFGRVGEAWSVLLLTGLIMLILFPAWLTDLGFILSFSATASLLLFGPKVSKLLKLPKSLKSLKFLKEGFATSLSAQVAVAPIIFATFGQFNPVSPLINALVLWTVPGIMAVGAAAGLVGLVLPGAGKLILYLTYPLTWWFVRVVSFF